MGRLETNVFAITNLSELSTSYRMYRIKGLHREHDEYYQNLQAITRKLSYALKAPVISVERDEIPYLVIPNDAGDPPSPFPLVRAAPAIFEAVPGVFQLDYTLRSPENDQICLRFLQFMIQAPLYRRSELWQPGAGEAFFQKRWDQSNHGVVRYTGFSIRAVVTSEGGLGLCVDVTAKTVSRTPLQVHLSRNAFHRWRGRHCIYHYGHQWYEIRLDALSDMNATEYCIQKDGRYIPILEYAFEESRKPLPEELVRVPHDASVVIYHSSRDEERGALAPLCYPVIGPNDEAGRSQHSRAILEPHIRRRMIRDFTHRYLQSLEFGDIQLQIDKEPANIPIKMFVVPDLEFGGETILSVKGTAGARHVSLDALGRARLDLLQNKEAGFYEQDPLDRQYFILPRSVYESFGTRFLEDLGHSVDRLFHQAEGYDPIVVPYNDSGPKTYPHQGKAILDAVKSECHKPGYAVVMIHETVDRQIREEDQLAAMVVRELRKQDIVASVIHSTTGQECYRLVTGRDGEPRYEPQRSKQGKLTGYLRGVALNKILLANQRWPFVLADRLYADITIGIDVKNNTAGLVIVGSNGSEIRSLLRTSRYKEQLYGNQLENLLIEILRKELTSRTEPLRKIVIHRDGRTFPSEIEQAKRAIEILQRDGSLDENASLTIFEIPKSSPTRLRMFEVFDKEDGGEWVENPQVGYYRIVNETEGYLCSTGRAFPRPGTVQPLHVRRVYGNLPLEQGLEDIYCLTVLAWTRPEDCTRYPITIKLNDRYLSEDATEYDEDALEKSISLEEEE